ncbi:MAG: LysE family translocator [Roseibium sp.]|uniref:LysE family translocator n=1 Tax=Roseibium sp. TaxID=1936156 RepID=UPI001B1C3C3B|nr:LysE family translocator [Roseibium sp.]MBO6509590.1 LysE family translocator [Roseibium sp.]MBO6891798.1 LysE family translocator [Roseibium sp.]MBO6931454.1 LysE family translocator [Roseibium sp.]
MSLETVLSFALVAALLVMSPGPNGVLIAKTVPTSGKAAAFSNVGGFVAAFFLHGSLSILGISVILVHSAEAFFVVKMIGAAYLFWIGLKALREAFSQKSLAPSVAPAKRKRTHVRAFGEGFLTNALNPKVSMFYLAAFPQFIPAGEGAVAAAMSLVVVHALINAIWFGSMIFLLSTLSGAARSPSFQRWLKGVTGLVFMGFGLKLATLRP